MGSILHTTSPFSIKRVCIIGAGPAGLAASKHLVAENSFDTIDIYEQQAEVGGVWNYTPPQIEHVSVPQTEPATQPDQPIWPKDGGPPIFSNPMYERLNTNIPKDLMQFSDQEFPRESLLFPTRQDVQQYLLQYARDLRHLIRFSTQVETISHFIEDGHDRWKVAFTALVTKERKELIYDALIIASGHYTVAFIPETEAIEAFDKAHPSVISHSKTYRSSAKFARKKVLVVGSGPSGLDIGTQISLVSQSPLLNSVHTPSSSPEGSKEEVPPIAAYLPETRGVRFTDGREEHNIDAVVYCTGYLYSYAFLNTIDPLFVTDGQRTRGLYQQLFSIAHPSIAFTALSQRVVPFPLSEVQGAAIAKVWSNKLALPSVETMQELERKQIEELGDGKGYHLLPFPKDADYIEAIYRWTKSAKGGFSKQPPCWGVKERWMRENFPAMKKAFAEDGGKATSMEEIGFRFEDVDVVERPQKLKSNCILS